jgi:phosphate/sulfate permease
MDLYTAVKLPVFILLALVSLGVLAGIIALLINPRTRVATGIVLVVAPVILLVVAALLFSVRKVAYNESHSIEHSPNTGINTYPPIAPPEAAEKVAVKPPTTSLAPGGTAARPAWVDAPPQLVDDVYQMAVVVGPYTTRQECDANLPEAIQEAVDQYVEVCLGPEEIDAVRLPAEYLRQQLVKDQWEEVRQHSVGPMTQLHVLLQFDRKVKDRVLKEHRQAVVAHRLWLTGAGLAAALGLLAAAFGYLKFTGAGNSLKAAVGGDSSRR